MARASEAAVALLTLQALGSRIEQKEGSLAELRPEGPRARLGRGWALYEEEIFDDVAKRRRR